MHSLKDTQFWLCCFLFIVVVVKNDLKLCVNHQFIAPSLYNQITQLIFITDISRPKIKCTTLFGQSFSVKTFDRSRNGCQVFGEGAGNDFRGPSVQALPLPWRVSFSRARFFLCSLLPSACYAGYREIKTVIADCWKSCSCCWFKIESYMLSLTTTFSEK